MEYSDGWSFWADRGGTFTDIIAVSPEGIIKTHKLLSTNPPFYEDAVAYGIKYLLSHHKTSLDNQSIKEIKIGTTLGTNALLSKTGESPILLITKGFKDLFVIGDQSRKDLFSIDIQPRTLLYDYVIEVPERVTATGKIITPINLNQIRPALIKAYDEGKHSIAIVLLHGFRFPKHEAELLNLCHKIGFKYVYASHLSCPFVKIIWRGETTLVDAYLASIINDYVKSLNSQFQETNLKFIKSDGGLTDAEQFSGKSSVLSGPAAGVVSATKIAARAGLTQVITFDMGGTSTDVCRCDKSNMMRFQNQIAGIKILTPMMDINTIAAGGGSIIDFQYGLYQVGPMSAGASPGPACYGKGGPLTITDCNLIVGKLLPDNMPRTFGIDGTEKLDVMQAELKLFELQKRIEQHLGYLIPFEEIADSSIQIAVNAMAQAIKKISSQSGYDVRVYSLACFGGAGGQHACQVADILGIQKIIIPPQAGVLSALGVGLAKYNLVHNESLAMPLSNSSIQDIAIKIKQIQIQLKQHIREYQISQLAQGNLIEELELSKIEWYLQLHLNYVGSDTTLQVTYSNYETVLAVFLQQHKQRFGFIEEESNIQISTLTITALLHEKELEQLNLASAEQLSLSGIESSSSHPKITRFYGKGCWVNARVFQRQQLSFGKHYLGPIIIVEPHSTVVVEEGWKLEINQFQDIILTKTNFTKKDIKAAAIKGSAERSSNHSTAYDPMLLELFHQFFMAIAEQMGTVLERTAHSVNIKERQDFSCAVFDHQGDLIANAPHIPVHLGSMSDAVKHISSVFGNLVNPDDVFVTNHPLHGGTHLPDITVISPVFSPRKSVTSERVIFWVATRGHHADVGGISPGSMPAYSSSLQEEGIIIDAVQIVKQGKFFDEKARQLFRQKPYPARNIKQNILDLKAQIAANQQGIRGLQQLILRQSESLVIRYARNIQDNTEAVCRQLLRHLKGGSYRMLLDNNICLEVNIFIDLKLGQATLDFSGTSAESIDNFNAPLAVTKAVVFYVFQCLLPRDLPLNSGCLRPFTIKVPTNTVLNPGSTVAVVAGNVELSQALANLLFAALGICASSPATMNNLTFGNDQYQYYETIAGGSGASQTAAGTTAVQTHMTNSKLTDPEILEQRYPVMLQQFEVRRGSGGRGKNPGGDGIVRSIQFLESMQLSFLSGNRIQPPWGLAGGDHGACGGQEVIRCDGRIEKISGVVQLKMETGDQIIIKTPGGGGYGSTKP